MCRIIMGSTYVVPGRYCCICCQFRLPGVPVYVHDVHDVHKFDSMV